ncbi:MAG: alanine racemase [Bacteroidales bacterium]|nr:MAG: alanine racemase [Bacteroidales bacterium]
MNRRNFFRAMAASPLVMKSLNSLSVANKPVKEHITGRGQTADPWLEVNMDNIAWNTAQIKQRVGNRPVMAVIKANAYGHGLLEMARYLEKQNVDALAVGKTAEALILRENGIRIPLLNFGPYSREEAKRIVALKIIQSVYNDNFIWLAEAAQTEDKTAPVHIKIDTGLGRVGVPYYRALPLIEKIADTKGIRIDGIFTPFTEDQEFDRVQLSRFLEVCESAKNKGIETGIRHAASSAGMISFPESYLDMVRPGIAIYGQYPSTRAFEEREIDLKPAMSLKSRIVYLKMLRKGDSISYHRSYTALKETLVATIPTGYSDGYPYQAGDKGDVLIRGKRCPVIGLVTANHFTVDVSGLERVDMYDEVVMFGQQGNREITVEEVASRAGTSVYKILIGMNPLLPKIYN